ncbi:MAG: pyridoxal phosphate-dependent aminotransferase [Terriglobales bacterium]
MLKPCANLERVKQYHPPLSGRSGLRLDFNENTEGCSPRVLERLRNLTAEELARYPEREPVERAVAQWLALSPEEVMLTNGVDEAIHLLCEAYLQTDAEAIIAVPTFGMYEVAASATGATVKAVAAEGFRFPAGGIMAQVTARTRLIAIANPNNPTGAVAAREELLAIADAANEAAILIDEAYFDFYGETLIGEINRRANLFVARTFSKAYGLAGLRAGVLTGPAGQMQFVRRIASPYNVNGVALACLPAALADREYVTAYVEAVRRGRDRLQAELAALGMPFWPSHANFVLARFGPARENFISAMRQRGILVRDRNSDPGCGGCVRITIGTEAHTDRLIAALREYAQQRRGAEVPA